MRRRELLLSATAMMSARAVRAQQQTTPVIGFLSGAAGPGPDTDALGQGLAEGGYVLGRNLNIEYRWAEGQFDRLPALKILRTTNSAAIRLLGRLIPLIGRQISAVRRRRFASDPSGINHLQG
jgi:putative ABC transport system substrate-binding protein